MGSAWRRTADRKEGPCLTLDARHVLRDGQVSKYDWIAMKCGPAGRLAERNGPAWFSKAGLRRVGRVPVLSGGCVVIEHLEKDTPATCGTFLESSASTCRHGLHEAIIASVKAWGWRPDTDEQDAPGPPPEDLCILWV